MIKRDLGPFFYYGIGVGIGVCLVDVRVGVGSGQIVFCPVFDMDSIVAGDPLHLP